MNTTTDNMLIPRRRAMDNPKTLGQICFEKRLSAEYKQKHFEDAMDKELSMAWNALSPMEQSYWELAAQGVVDEIQRRLAAAATANK